MANEPATAERPLAVITGASSGIGLELARVFAKNGYDLVIAAEDDGIHTAASALASLGAQVEAVQVDLAGFDGVEELVERIEAIGTPIDSVAINAGVGVGGEFATETSLEDELNLINLNVTSAVHLAKRVSGAMVAQRHGRILFTSSIAATMPAPLEAVYGASKAFLLSFAEALRSELADHNVVVTALMPGATETNFFHRAGMDDTKVGRQEKDDPAKVAQQGFDALMAGDDKVVAGSFKNKLQAAAARVISDPAKAAIHRKLAENVDDEGDEVERDEVERDEVAASTPIDPGDPGAPARH